MSASNYVTLLQNSKVKTWFRGRVQGSGLGTVKGLDEFRV